MKKAWQTRKIGDVCSLTTGGTPDKTKPEYFGGKIRWLVSGDINQGEIFECEGRITEAGMKASNAKLLPVNSVMIALNGQGKTRGSVALLRTVATCNQSLVCICPNDPDQVLPEFLFANLQSRYQELRQLTGDSGNDRRGLNMSLIRDIAIPIAPIAEQKHIVALLEEAFAAIATTRANTEQNLRNAVDLFGSYLGGVFANGGDGWVETSLRDCVQSVSTGPFGSLLHKSDYQQGGLPLVNPINIRGDQIVPDPKKAVGAATAKRLAAYALRSGDVVIARRGEIGRCSVVSSDQAGWLCGTGCFVIRPSTKTDPNFLAHLIRSRPYRQRLEYLSARATMPSISNDDLANLVIRLPPMPEQRRIAALLKDLSDASAELSSVHHRKLAALDTLKQALLHQAFAGAL